MMILNWTELMRKVDKINEQFNAWTDKFTDNNMFAIVVTVVMFILAVIVIGNLSKKQK